MKSKSKSKTTSTYAYMTPPTTPAMAEYHAATQAAFNTPDPSIAFSAGGAKQTLRDRFDNPFGQNYSPEVREAMQYAGEQNINQYASQAYREDASRRRGEKLGHMAAYAGMTAPNLVQTGGSAEGSQTHPIGPALIGAVGTAAGGWLS